jgi:fructose/tagatose bisphosphate aldolase
MKPSELDYFLSVLKNSITIADDGSVSVTDLAVLKANIHKLAEVSALESGVRQVLARYLTRAIALHLDIVPASINSLYLARGRGEVPVNFTVPAINLRALTCDAARAVFRTAIKMNAGALIFEIARSEIGYTDQRPSEYTTSVLSAAIAEGFQGPVFLQGDHFQVSAKRYNTDRDTELQTVLELTKEAIEAGFYNIDIDTSTLVDLSFPTVEEQQRLNSNLSAMFTNYIRSLEPSGVTISVGGEIGEVGKKNSTEEELRAYTDGFNNELNKLNPGAIGLSKISIQTGTSHGGVVLPDGSIAQVSVDFETLLHLSKVARETYGMAGTVQHGASTLPQEAFGKFVDSQACEVHLATNFQNLLYDRLPNDLLLDIFAYLDKNHNNERKPDMTDEQFYYKTRKRALGPFKSEIWALPEEVKLKVFDAWEAQFDHLFSSLGIADTQKYVDQFVDAPKVHPNLDAYLALAGAGSESEDTTDLAD